MEIKIPIVIGDEALEKAIDKRIAEMKQDGDFVLVTRCKDCKYYNPNYSRFDSDIPYNRCEHPAQQFDVECYDMWLETNPDDFCSYAEQKEIEGE